LTEINEKLRTESEQSNRLKKQVNELTVLLQTKEETLSEKVNHLQEAKDRLELELAKNSVALEKEESTRLQAAGLQVELENRSQTLQSELLATRDRENRMIQDNKALLQKLVEAEKSSASLELQLKALSAKYDQEVKAIHNEMERRSPSNDKEDQVKGKVFTFELRIQRQRVFLVSNFFCKSNLQCIIFICRFFKFKNVHGWS